ncbi:MAG: DUF2807 domain-containing protein [Prolixibacteraceae bacterium]|nr:DUF2807 domain-containing protein [Prolixibacteraceae bacterium]MBN2773574.1 DUF2807 domain-containing protein [Prolixibacteraceae bacterium]
MKTKLFALLVLISGLFITFQASAEKEKRDVPSFTEISLRVPGVLYIKQGNSQSVEIEAKSTTLEKIETEVKGGELIIKFENERFFWRNFKPGEIEINITVPEIEALGISGSGDIIAQDRIETGSMDLSISGSGDIKLADLKASRVKASISGSGDIAVEGGGAGEASVSISGSGNVDMENFEAKDVSVRVSGSGNARISASDNLEVRVAGSGDVYYTGNPNIDSSVAGSGSIKKIR